MNCFQAALIVAAQEKLARFLCSLSFSSCGIRSIERKQFVFFFCCASNEMNICYCICMFFCFLSSYFIWEQKKRANASLFKNILSYVFVQLDFFFFF